jgi:formate-dependent nitrite reductase membrane component NrfD
MNLLGTGLAPEFYGYGSLVALVLAAIGGLMLMIEAGNKAKAYLIIANPSSAASKNAVFMTLAMGFAFVFATFFFSFIPWAGVIWLKNLVAIIAFVVSLCAVVIPGIELGEARGRAFWNTSALVPLFLLTSAASGLAVVLVLLAAMGFIPTLESVLVNAVLIVFLVLSLISMVTYVNGMKHAAAEEAKRGAKLILEGPLTGSFWFGAIIIGTIIPLLLYLFAATPAALAVKGILILIGMCCFRSVFLQAAVRTTVPGEENEWYSHEELVEFGKELEKRWQEKAAWLNK